MLVLPEGISRDDIGQWLYSGICMAKLSMDGEYRPAVLDRVTEEDRTELGYTARVRLLDDGFDITHIIPTEFLAGHWPMCGSVNVEEHRVAVHVERLPARQFKRTFNARQVAIHVPRPWEVRKVRGNSAADALRVSSPCIIQATFYPVYPTHFEEALVKLSEGWLSVAINPRIIIAGDDIGKRMIYYRGKLAATILGEQISPVADVTTCRLIDKVLEGRYVWTVALA